MKVQPACVTSLRCSDLQAKKNTLLRRTSEKEFDGPRTGMDNEQSK